MKHDPKKCAEAMLKRFGYVVLGFPNGDNCLVPGFVVNNFHGHKVGFSLRLDVVTNATDWNRMAKWAVKNDLSGPNYMKPTDGAKFFRAVVAD